MQVGFLLPLCSVGKVTYREAAMAAELRVQCIGACQILLASPCAHMSRLGSQLALELRPDLVPARIHGPGTVGGPPGEGFPVVERMLVLQRAGNLLAVQPHGLRHVLVLLHLVFGLGRGGALDQSLFGLRVQGPGLSPSLLRCSHAPRPVCCLGELHGELALPQLEGCPRRVHIGRQRHGKLPVHLLCAACRCWTAEGHLELVRGYLHCEGTIVREDCTGTLEELFQLQVHAPRLGLLAN
mmetsp:Transcript_70163/g.159271  ORF Transcript_70163/g.159271 Transcript_70163/m.159271 type:complete len:240 (+) Transcript_70163:655-1374(+)